VVAHEHFLAWYFKQDEEKAKEWEHWLLSHPDSVPMVQQSIAWLKANYMEEPALPVAEVETAYQKLDTALDAAPVIVLEPRRRRWWIPAAAAVLLVLVGLAWWRSQPGKTVLDSNYGKLSAYNLPDGSQVLLNANSQITMSKEWEKGHDREVWLNGEAFFKVQKTPMKNRFIVHTKTMDIIVTGTQFNAVCREDESSVLLTEGSVTIRTPDGREIHMKPGDFVQLENNIPAKKPADQEKILAWKQAKLDFENTPMSEVEKIITRHYGIKVTLSDATLAGKTISGVMPNDNLDVLIQSLEATGEFKITKGDHEILISHP
jgi:ferric-dicitrate binding protein FerR (iron transport regulator)